MVPKIVERKILKVKKPGGLKQYLMTLPKEYAEDLESKGVDKLVVAFDGGLAAFPKISEFTEKALLSFLSKHSDLERLFSRVKRTTEQRGLNDVG